MQTKDTIAEPWTRRLATRGEGWLRRERERWSLAAERAGVCLALSGGALGAWVIALWLSGASWVYADGVPPPDRANGSAAVPTAPVERSERVPTAGTDAPVTKPYVFDGRSREVGGGEVTCPEQTLTEYRGERVALSPPARVAEPFVEHVRALERAVRERSLEFYDRLPSAILVAASFDCRSVSGRRRLSEHALGNAIDISGFRFDALDGAAAFEVRVDRHWRASGEQARHSRFLHALTETLLERGVFRTLLGPAHPDHADHFHFDMAPHHYVNL